MVKRTPKYRAQNKSSYSLTNFTKPVTKINFGTSTELDETEVSHCLCHSQNGTFPWMRNRGLSAQCDSFHLHTGEPILITRERLADDRFGELRALLRIFWLV